MSPSAFGVGAVRSRGQQDPDIPAHAGRQVLEHLLGNPLADAVQSSEVFSAPRRIVMCPDTDVDVLAVGVVGTHVIELDHDVLGCQNTPLLARQDAGRDGRQLVRQCLQHELVDCARVAPNLYEGHSLLPSVVEPTATIPLLYRCVKYKNFCSAARTRTWNQLLTRIPKLLRGVDYIITLRVLWYLVSTAPPRLSRGSLGVALRKG